MRHMYYYDPAILDLQKMRADAASRAVGDKYHDPEEVTIHHHAVGMTCDNKHHEHFTSAQKETV